jgi:hypothetical protein
MTIDVDCLLFEGLRGSPTHWRSSVTALKLLVDNALDQSMSFRGAAARSEQRNDAQASMDVLPVEVVAAPTLHQQA